MKNYIEDKIKDLDYKIKVIETDKEKSVFKDYWEIQMGIFKGMRIAYNDIRIKGIQDKQIDDLNSI